MSVRIKTEDFRAVAGTALSGSLADVGSPTAAQARTVLAFNGCDKEVVLSWDNGVTSGFLLPALGAFSVDCASNKDENDTTPFLPVGSQFKASHNGEAPTEGNLSITVVT